MKLAEIRSHRINSLYQKALGGKFTINGVFSEIKLITEAKLSGISSDTAEDYAKTIIIQLKKAGHLK